MYGNREESVLDKDVPEIPTDGATETADERDPAGLSAAERARLKTATNRVRRAVEALVPDVTEIEARVAETPQGVAGVVVLQAPGLPPVGATIQPDAGSLATDPVLTDAEVRTEATDLVAQAAVLARQSGLDTDGMPAY
jgi:hypothetical protein